MRGSYALDGLDKRTRYERKLADVVECPECGKRWQRTNRQRDDKTMFCSQSCVGRNAGVQRGFKATRDAVAKYRTLVKARLGYAENQCRDVELHDILRLMLEARRDGIRVGVLREASRRRPRRSMAA